MLLQKTCRQAYSADMAVDRLVLDLELATGSSGHLYFGSEHASVHEIC